MRSEKDVKAKLLQIRKTFKVSKANFEQYDNYEDMHALELMDAQIGVLDWVLNEG